MTEKDISTDPFLHDKHSDPPDYSIQPDLSPRTLPSDDFAPSLEQSLPPSDPQDLHSQPKSGPSSSPTPPPPLPPPEDLPEPSGPSLLTLGTVVVIGAMAANVIGFRYSRWAVGKDVHRAWETHQRNTASRATDQRARRASEHRARRAAEQAAEQAERAARAARADTSARADRQARDEARGAYQRWERVFRDGDRESFFREFRVEVDPHVVEELLRAQRGAARGSRRGNPFGMPDEMLQELLRAARGGQGGTKRTREEEEFDPFRIFEQMQRENAGARGRRREADFDPFRFWEQMQGAQWRDFERGMGGGPGAGGGGGGVFRQAGLSRYYSTLGLDSNASEAQVKAAYRKEVMKWHPDRYRGNEPEKAAKRFREVTEAYDAITNNR